MANPLKKLLGHTAVYGLSSIVGRLLNYLLVPLYTALFLPAEYGVVTDLYAYVGFFLVLLTYGMETAFFRFSETKKDKEKVFSTALISLFFTSVFFIFVLILFSGSVANILQYSENQEYIIWFAVIIGVDAFVSLPFARLRRENKAVRFAVFKFINIGLNISLNLFFLLLCPYLLKNNFGSAINYIYNPEIGIGYIFISNLAASIFTLLLFIPDFLKINYKFSKVLLRQMLIYGLPLLFAGLAGMINEVIDRILLKFLTVVPENIGNSNSYIMAQIGIYGANYKLSILMTLFIQAFRYAGEPFFFSLQKEKGAKKVYADVLKYFIIFGLIIFLGIMFYIDIVKYFINSSYHEGLKIVPILLFANLFLGIIYNLSVWYKLTDRTRFAVYIAGGGAAITLILNIILIPFVGYIGSAWATFVCYFSMMTASYFLGQKYYKINYDLKNIFIYVFISLSIYFISGIFDFSGLLKYAVNTFFIIIFFVVIFIKERKIILKI